MHIPPTFRKSVSVRGLKLPWGCCAMEKEQHWSYRCWVELGSPQAVIRQTHSVWKWRVLLQGSRKLQGLFEVQFHIIHNLTLFSLFLSSLFLFSEHISSTSFSLLASLSPHPLLPTPSPHPSLDAPPLFFSLFHFVSHQFPSLSSSSGMAIPSLWVPSLPPLASCSFLLFL